jgi:hypothetical protein
MGGRWIMRPLGHRIVDFRTERTLNGFQVRPMPIARQLNPADYALVQVAAGNKKVLRTCRF